MATMFGFYLNHSHIQQARPGLLVVIKGLQLGSLVKRLYHYTDGVAPKLIVDLLSGF